MNRKKNLLTEEDYKKIIIDSLYDNELISDEIYEKCRKPHVTSLPGDARSNDPEVLKNRKRAINDKIKSNKEKLEKLDKDMKFSKGRMNDTKGWTEDSLNDLTHEFKKIKDLFFDGDAYDNEDHWQNWGIGSEYHRLSNNLNEFEKTIDKINSNLKRYFDGDLKQVNGFNKANKLGKQILKDVKSATKTQLVPNSWVKYADNILLYLKITQDYYKMHGNASNKYNNLASDYSKIENILNDLYKERDKVNDKLS